MLPDEHIVYDELKRKRREHDQWQPEALRLPLHIPRHDEEAHSEDTDEGSRDRGVVIIDMNDGYAIVD